MQINGNGFSCAKDAFRKEFMSASGEIMSKLQKKTASVVVAAVAALVAAIVIPQRADAQGNTGQTKADASSKITTKADCEKAKLKWDDTAKKCSR